MREEIHERLNLIMLNDPNLLNGATPLIRSVYEDGYPALLDDTKLPAVIWTPRADDGYTRSGGHNYDTNVIYEGRVYLAPAGTQLSTIQNIRALRYPDLVVNALLSRPFLEYNGSGLNNLYAETSVRIISDLARPIPYPINRRDLLYWGFIVRVIIPYMQTIEIVAE